MPTIFHLADAHKTKEMPAYLNLAIARVQFNMIELIRQYRTKYPSAPIVVEELAEKWDSSNKNQDGVITAKAIFPHGIPANFTDLNHMQQRYLCEIGAANILYFLDEIPELYPSITKRVAADCRSKKAEPSQHERIHRAREVQAMFHAETASIETHSDAVLLIYGSGHDFSEFQRNNRLIHRNDSAVNDYIELLLASAPSSQAEAVVPAASKSPCDKTTVLTFGAAILCSALAAGLAYLKSQTDFSGPQG